MKISERDLAETEVKNDSGKPIVVYHGTSESFDVLSDARLQSMGFHFGDPVQANHFAGSSSGARVIPVFLMIRDILDIRPSDLGWLRPKQTAIALLSLDIFSVSEAVRIVGGENFSLACHTQLESIEVRREQNRQIIAILEKKGFDGILYTNKQEPGDGLGRDAYLVFRANQVFSAITGDCLCENGVF